MSEYFNIYNRFARYFLLGITGITVLYRFLHLGEQSFWLDEIYTAMDSAEQLSFEQVLKNATILHQHHPPLYFLLVNGFLKITHLSGEVGFRSLSLIFALGTVWVIWETGRRIRQETLALGMVAVYSSSHLCLWFSMEARSYSFSFFLTSLLALLVLVQVQNPRNLGLIGIVFISICLLYTSYFGLFLVPSAFLFYLFHDGSWKKKRFLEVLLSGIALGIAYIPLVLIVTGQTSTPLEYIRKPGAFLFREAWVYMFQGGSLEYYVFAFALLASPLLWKKYKTGLGMGYFLLIQIGLFVFLSFLFSWLVLPILHHKYFVYIFQPLLFLILLNFFLILPKPVFLTLTLLLTLKNLFYNSYFSLPSTNKSPYRPYIANIASTVPEIPVVTNVGEFASYYSEIQNQNLRFLPAGMSKDSSRLLLREGFWEFHMHGPFRFFETTPSPLKDSLLHIGTAGFDVISFVSLYFPKHKAIRFENSLDEAGSVQRGRWSAKLEAGSYRLVFIGKSLEDFKTVTLDGKLNDIEFRFRMDHLEKFYSIPFQQGSAGRAILELNPLLSDPDQIRIRKLWIIKI